MADQDTHDEIDTLRLVRRFQAGNRSAFRGIYLRWYEHVYAYVRLTTPASMPAEPIAQRVFERALSGLPHFSPATDVSFRAWIAGHACRAGRHDQRAPFLALSRATDAEPAPTRFDELASLADEQLILHASAVPLPERRVLLLRLLFGLDAAETAAAYGEDVEVGAMQRRALDLLHRRIAAAGQAASMGHDQDELRRLTRVMRQRRRALAA